MRKKTEGEEREEGEDGERKKNEEGEEGKDERATREIYARNFFGSLKAV